ncbi:MAG: glycosyltransferase family 4 protein [Candidatus Kapabacteria bacterium]|nr:glycosyltransferase family 4 protein [Candidatus Kapabacteria bacterium]
MGINTDLFKIQNKNLNLINKYGNNFKYIIFVGAVIKEKGIWELVEAMKIVVKENSNIKLLVIGDGNSKEKLIQYAKVDNLQNNIEFLGFISNKSLPEYYSIASLLVLPSYSEGFGLVVAEAMACGVKPIVSNLPTFRDFVTTETGVFLDSINPVDIANNILKLIECEPNNLEMEKIRKIIVEKYSWMTVINNYNKIYKN